VSPLFRRLALTGAGAAAARGLLRAAEALPPGTRAGLDRTNHRGEPVSLVAGPVVALAATASAVAGAGTPRLRAAVLVAGLGAGALGLYDDIVGARPEQRADKGFRGHLRALAAGRVSAGAVKVAGIGAAGLAAGALLGRTPGRPVRTAADAVVAGGIVAGTANLLNLLDLRPGRAVKAAALLGAPLLTGEAGDVVAGPLGAAAAVLPEDLAESVMLGDAGANALGALLGLGLAARLGPAGRWAALGVLVALTAASERVSFTRVIESTPGLRELDRLGRRPVGDPTVGPAGVPSVPAAVPDRP
jgi:UDP-N-acetylmuramyl pentapeptide phosphotransferase/UDP-N-acetylglucosamine-1-phosphate transferase